MITWSAHLSTLFTEHPYADRPAAARSAGFLAVEAWWPPSDAASAWATEIARHGLAVATINSYSGAIEAGERGFLNVPDRREDVLEDFQRALALAQSVGAERINVPVGRALPDVRRSHQLDVVTTTLRDVAALAAAKEIVVLVEPINEHDIPGYLVPTAREAGELITRVGSSSLQLLYDAYHAARSGADPATEVRSFGEIVGHVQYADCPGRGAPGTGLSSLERLVDSLDAIGYDGFVGMEYHPRGATADSLDFLHTWSSVPHTS